MRAEWSAECGAEDPVLVVPWSAADDPCAALHDPAAHFIDLRENPYDLDQIAEAEQHAPLRHALRALNAARSPVFTAKCDAWTMHPAEIDDLTANLDLPPPPEPLTAGFASYLDLIWRERALYVSFHAQGQRLDRLTRLLEPLRIPEASVESVLRPALIDFTGPQEGFAVTLYVKALGADPAGAYQSWSAALEAVTTVLRSRDFTAA